VRLGVPHAQLERLHDMIATRRPNVKRDDARLALEAAAVPREPTAPNFQFEPTVLWQRLVSTTARTRDSEETSSRAMASEVVRHARLVLSDLRETVRQALLGHLIPIEAERLELAASITEIEAAANAFRRERGLASADATRAWLDRQGLTVSELAEIARRDALLEKLLEYYAEPSVDGDAMLALELQRQGRYAALADEVARKKRGLRREVPDSELLAWHARAFGPIPGTLDEHARRRGFNSRFELLDEMAATFEEE
jgi:hypothetical protein